MQVCRRRSTAYLDPRRLRRKTSHCDRLHSPLIGDETFSASESTFMPRWGPSGIGLLRCHGRTTGARTEQARPISGSGQGRPASFASTVKVQRSAVGSGSGRLGRVWPKSQLGRNYWFWIDEQVNRHSPGSRGSRGHIGPLSFLGNDNRAPRAQEAVRNGRSIALRR